MGIHCCSDGKRHIGGAEGLLFDVEHGQLPPEGRDREAIQRHGPHSRFGLAIGLLGATSHRDQGFVARAPGSPETSKQEAALFNSVDRGAALGASLPT
jgi:hypothetical protein